MSRLQGMHPECRSAWENDKTSYPIEEHIRDCDQCQLYKILAFSDNLLSWQRDVLDVLLSGNIRTLSEYAQQQRRAEYQKEKVPLTLSVPASIKRT